MFKKLGIGLLIGYCILVIGYSVAGAVPVRDWGDRGTIIAAALGGAVQYDAVAVSDAAGGAIMVWLDGRHNAASAFAMGGTYAIYAQRVDGTGNKLWTPTNGVTICASDASDGMPDIVADGAGGAIVTWIRTDPTSSVKNVYAQKINSSGAVQWTTNGLAVCSNASGQSVPKIASDGAGGAIITWADARDMMGDIYAQKVSSDGTVGGGSWIADGVAVCTNASNQAGPEIASDGASGAIIVWTDGRDMVSQNYAQKVTADGTVGGGLWSADGIRICTTANTQYNPKIIADGSGGAIVAWEDMRDAMNYHIYAQKVANDGSVSWGPDGVAVCAAANSQYAPNLVSNGAGGAIVTWYDGRVDGINYDIYAQRVLTDGTAGGGGSWGSNGVLICGADGAQDIPKITTDGAGGAIIAWDDYRTVTGIDIYAQKVNSEGAVSWADNGVVICSSGGAKIKSQLYGIVASSVGGNNGAVIVWVDGRNDAGGDIFARRVSGSGSPQWTDNGAEVCAAKLGVAQNSQVMCAWKEGGKTRGAVAWIDARAGANDIYVQKFNERGEPMWAADGVPVVVDSATISGKRVLGDICRLSNGYIVVAWAESRDKRDTGSDIYLQVFDASNGSRLTGAGGFEMVDDPNDQKSPSMAPDDDGGLVVVWSQAAAALGGIGVGLFEKADNRNLLANAYISDSLDLPSLNGLEFAADKAGDPGVSVVGIYAKKITSAGAFDAAWGTDADQRGDQGKLVNAVLADPKVSPVFPSVVNLGGDALGVTWMDNRNDTVNGTYDIYYQKLSLTTGARQFTDDVLVCNAANSQYYPCVAKAADGAAVVTWMDERAGRNVGAAAQDQFKAAFGYTDIYAQRINSSGVPEWTANGVEVLKDESAYGNYNPRISVDPAGNSLIAFLRVENITGAYDVLVQSLNSSGNTILSLPGFKAANYSGTKSAPSIAAVGVGQAVVAWDPAALGMVNVAKVVAGGDTDININSISGLQTQTVPAAPTDLIGIPESSIRWSWKDNSSDEDGFALFDGNENLITTLPANTTTFLEIDGLHPNTLYTRKVRAYNATGYSNPSKTVSVYTLASIPTIQITDTGADTITLGLTGDVNGSKYKWERGTGGSFTAIADNQTSTTHRDTRCQAETTYYYRVSAYNGDGVLSLPSATVSAKLGAVVLKSPTVAVTSLGRPIRTGDYCEVLTFNAASQNTAGSIITTLIKITDKNNTTVYEHTFNGVLSSFDLDTAGIPDGPITVVTRVTDSLSPALYTDTTNQINYARSVQVVGGWGVAVGRGGATVRAVDAGQADFITMGYHLTRSGDINLLGYATDGSLLMNLRFASGVNGAMVGSNSAIWDGRTPTGGVVPRGLYIIKIINNGRQIGRIAIPILAK